MKIKVGHTAGLGLIDAMFAMAVAGILFGGLYAGLQFGFTTIQFARENTRATQIMLEKMETVRLYTWSQLNDPAFVPSTFNTPYYAVGKTNAGLVYTGRLTITNSGLGTTYAPNMRKVTVDLTWSTGTQLRRRTMSTFVSKEGMYRYVYY